MFNNTKDKLSPVKEVAFKKEKDLQSLTEKNLGTIFGLEFVATEYAVQNLYIDTLAYDPENKSFVIIEYKRDRSFSVVDQGFSYLSLMLNNKADFILAYNEAKNKSLKREDIDWSQARIIFIARSFTAHQQNAVNFKNMPFSLWEAVQYDNYLVQYRKLETSDGAETLAQLKNIGGETQKIAKEVKTYTEDDVVGKDGKIHDLYIEIKDKIMQSDMELKPNPKKVYIGYQVPDNWRNVFNIQKNSGALIIHFTRSKPEDFEDPKKKMVYMENSRQFYNQDVTTLEVKDIKDVSYALLMIQQTYDRFVKEFGN